MDFLFTIVIFGVVGGAIMALWLVRRHRLGAAWDTDGALASAVSAWLSPPPAGTHDRAHVSIATA